MTVLRLTDDWLKNTEARAVPGAYFDRDERAWCVELDGMSVWNQQVVATLFPEHADQLDFKVEDTIRPLDYATDWFKSHDSHGWFGHVEDTLHEYQRTDLAYLAARMRADGGAYLGWDRGLGKTLGSIALAIATESRTIAVVCPNSAKAPVWEAEVKKWDPTSTVYIVGGNKRKREDAVAGWLEEDPRAPRRYLILHYEALRLLGAYPTDLMVVDEAHRLAKGAGRGKGVPQFYKALLRWRAKYRLALSGSILVNSLSDLFGSLHWMYPTVYKSKWKDWHNRYIRTVDGTFSRHIPVGVKPDKVDELRKELATFMCVRHKEDELDMPTKIEQDFVVDLSPSQQKAYEDMVDTFMAELDDGSTVIATATIAKLSILRQISTGLDLVGDVQDSTKLDLARDLIMDTPETDKVVVFTWHKAAAHALADRLVDQGINTVTITGDTSMRRRDEYLNDFKHNEPTRVLVATIKTMGESVNLQHANHVIFVEQSWTPADMDQARDRVYRQGQDKRVTVSNIIARGTLDETRVLPTLKSKGALRRALLGGE